jgi:hypothetical protein
MKKALRVQPIRLGGKGEDGRQRAAVSLELVATQRAPDAPVHAWVDWEGVADVCAFTRKERAVWLSCFRDDRPHSTGLTAHERGAAAREIRRKLQHNVARLRPFVGYLTENEIYLQENWSTRRNQASLGAFIEGLQVSIDELKEKLQAAQQNRERVSLHTHNARLALESAESALAKAESEARADAVAAILEDRESPAPALRKKLAELRTAVAARQDELTAAQAALTKAQGTADKLAGEVEARRREAFLAELQPIRKRLIEHIYAAVPDAVEARDLAVKYGMTNLDLSGGLFPQGTPGWQHQLDDIGPRNGLAATVNDLLNLHGMGERHGLARAV